MGNYFLIVKARGLLLIASLANIQKLLNATFKVSLPANHLHHQIRQDTPIGSKQSPINSYSDRDTHPISND